MSTPEQITTALPSVCFHWRFGSAQPATLKAECYRPQPYHFHHHGQDIWVLGSPILNERIDRAGTALGLAQATDLVAFSLSLNGEFLLIAFDPSTQILRVINDRYASIPWYYTTLPDAFFGAVYYSDCWGWIKQQPHFAIHSEALFEFFCLQKLMGSKTYDRSTRYLRPASILTIRPHERQRQTYWQPHFAKQYQPFEQAVNRFIDLLHQAVKRKTNDQQRWGLLLSGGMDTRTVLAAFDQPLHTFTVGFQENREVAVARAVAAIKQQPHTFVRVPTDYYERHLVDIVHLLGGMNVYDHCLFFDLHAATAPHADVVFHGHGFDYLFQGMYIPVTYRYFLGHKTYFKQLRPLSEDIPTEFLHHIHFRLKHVDWLSYIRPQHRHRLRDWMHDSLQKLLRSAQTSLQTTADAWEYLIVHALSRHYSNANIASIVRYAEQRTLSFDNDLFDFYCALPIEYRLHARLLRRALVKMNRRLADYPSANHGLRIANNPWQMQRDHLLRHLKYLLTHQPHYRHPTAQDRTWPYRSDYLRLSPELMERIRRAGRSERLAEAMPFLDMDAMTAATTAWIQTGQGSADMMATLLTLDQFLSQT